MKDHKLFGISTLSREADRTYPEKNIFLTGFMGSGKSTVGRLLAESLNRPFVDMDAELTKYHNKSVSEVFAESGEAYFRQTETGLLKKLNGQDQPKVIATGGGIVESQYNCDILKGALTFFLNLPAEAAWERVDDENRGCRPLAADPVAFKALHAKRLGLYAKCGAEFSALPSPSKVRDNILDFILYQEPFELSAEGKTCLIRTYAPASGAAQLLGEILGPSKAMVLMDHRFRDEPDAFNGALADVPVVYAKHRGEEAKTLAEATDVLLAMAEAKLDRSDYLLVRGGGSLTDLGALCAGLYRRGLNLILVPTTLLAAVDAAIGGKAAVNLAGAKNQVGLFHLPKEVWLDPLVLRGLPGELWREGLVEAYKTALLFDPILQALIARQINNVLAGDLLLLSQIAHDSARHKANLVAKDLREELGLRDVLNLGHTYGHAVESFYAPHLSHGRAVALGLAVALIYSRDRHGFDPELAKNAIGVCRRLAGGAFPDPPPDAETAKLLGFDKKIRGGQLKFVALKAPGESVVDPSVPVGDILEAVRGLSKDAREA